MDSFEFEYKGERYRFCRDEITTSQKHDGKQWWEQVQIVGLAKAGVDALLSRVTALEAELAAAKAECGRLNFLETAGLEKDGWCEHERRYNENAVDREGDSYDNCVMCERDNLRAENAALREKLAETKGEQNAMP